MLQDNAMVSFYKGKTSDMGGRTVVDLDNPVLEDLPVLLQDMTQALEPSTVGRSEGQRPMEWRALAVYRDELESLVTTGMFLRVTHDRHPVTNQWRPKPVGKEPQFHIGAVNISSSKPRYFDLGLHRDA